MDKCQIRANFKETSLFWLFTSQMYCTLIILLPAPVCAGFDAGWNSQVVFGAGHYGNDVSHLLFCFLNMQS